MPVIGIEFDEAGNVIKDKLPSSKDFQDWASQIVREDFKMVLDYFNWDIHEQPIKFEIAFKEHYIDYPNGKAWGRVSGKYRIRIVIPNSHKWWIEGGHRKCRHVLIHEMFHLKGMEHNDFYYKQGYYSNFTRDTFTPPYIDKIFGSNPT